MVKKRIVRRVLPDRAGPEFEGLASVLHPVLARAYRAREISSPRELDVSLEQLPSWELLGGVDAATRALAAAIAEDRRILVVGDFDADGATSCAVAVRALGMMGARQVRYLVPDRFNYGYGLTPEIVAVAKQWQPHLLITVDNGIASCAGVAAARSFGIEVVITDHHLPGAELPAAVAIVNPNLPDDPFPCKHLAGVGVIFYVMLALRAQLRAARWFSRRGLPEPNLAQLLDLVALGTVADVVRLDHTNRILVAQGLARIRAGRCCAGIAALIEVAQRSRHRLVAADLGFALGPRLNAAGRLHDMSIGIECLLSDDFDHALALARRLDDLNRERRVIEQRMQDQAAALIAGMPTMTGDLDAPRSLALYDASWHQGVIGILASRIKERVHRPVVAFARADDGQLKGSARSVAGVHIRDALDAVATRHPGLIERFGGHAMAAGLTIRRENLDRFRAEFELEVARHLGVEDLHGVILSDGPLRSEDLSLEVAELIRGAGPWGQGFPEPVFDGAFEVIESRVVGQRHWKLQLDIGDGGHGIDAIAFNSVEPGVAAPGGPGPLNLAYRLDVNDYRGASTPQLIVEHIA